MSFKANCLAATFLIALCASPAGQSEDPQIRLSRLAALGKLWAAVEHFHPSLGHPTNIDWDAALVAAIPSVRTARTSTEYGTAVERMLAALKDPVTGLVVDSSNRASTIPPSSTRQPSYELTSNRVALIASGDRSDQPDYLTAVRKVMAAAVADLGRVRAVVFDLRSQTPSTPARGWVSFALASSGLTGLLTSAGLTTPGEQIRVPGAFRVTDGRRVPPASGAQDRPIVFLINANSDLPVEALSLQAMGNAAIVAEGQVSDAAVVNTTIIPLSDGLAARLRLGELVYDDGLHPFEPDVVLPASRGTSGSDSARVSAEQLALRFTVKARVRRGIPARGVERDARSSTDSRYPPVEYRLLAAFRIWATIQYSFPYHKLMREDWDAVLEKFLARMEEADDALAYHLAVAEMVTYIHDSHGIVESPILGQYFGTAAPPVRARMIEGLPVITAFRDVTAATAAGADIGDVILRVDGERVEERIARYGRYVSASTEQAHLRDILDRRSLNATSGGILFGAPDSTLNLLVRTPAGETKELKLPRTDGFTRVTAQRTGPILAALENNIGYVDLDRLTRAMLDDAFERFKAARGIIFDMRGYPRMMQQEIAGRLADRDAITAALFEYRIATAPGIGPDNSRSVSDTRVSAQLFARAGRARYTGRTVMLIDERTQSAAEHLGLFLRAANGTTFVGSPSAGANGNAGPVALPGGIRFSMSWLGVTHPDGRPLQRVGLVPDVEVKPTLKGIQEGRDEVLEAAVRYLQSTTTDRHP